nr:tetratricopeptide repeat protein [Planctomycetota bacterium]
EIVGTLLSRSSVSFDRGAFAEAEDLLYDALEREGKISRPQVLTDIYMGLSRALEYRGEYEEAERLLRSAIGLSERFGLWHHVATGYAKLGRLFAGQGQIPPAREFLRAAEQGFEAIAAHEEAEQIRKALHALPDGERMSAQSSMAT